MKINVYRVQERYHYGIGMKIEVNAFFYELFVCGCPWHFTYWPMMKAIGTLMIAHNNKHMHFYFKTEFDANCVLSAFFQFSN